MIIEGPSGIGKTTTITKAIDEIGKSEDILSLTARNKEDVDLVKNLPSMNDIGTVIIDDFHRLDEKIKESLSDFMKILADSENSKSKLVLLGINKAGQQLFRYAGDLGFRVDVFRLESNPQEKIEEIISLGESVLNISIVDKENMAAKAQGSFHIGQMLCHKLCTFNGITESLKEHLSINTSIEVITEVVLEDLSRQFKESALTFARGSKLRREGRAPYLHILRWLAESDEWSLDLSEAVASNPEHKASVGQVLEKGYLSHLLKDPEKRSILEPHFHYDETTRVLSVEDPKLIFYLKNLVWRAFTQQAGFTVNYFKGRYDFALSFSGSERWIAEKLFNCLVNREVTVFYDAEEQHRSIARPVEEYLTPIYRSEAMFVIPIISPDYPTRIWTKIESDSFKDRFGSNSVIPILLDTTREGFFSDEQKYGHLSIKMKDNIDEQISKICDTLCRRLVEDREMMK